jgi:hypothetical protein
MMAGLADHFGEDARLPAATAADIGVFLQTYAAESWDTKAAHRFRRVAPAEPLRITATPFGSTRTPTSRRPCSRPRPCAARATAMPAIATPTPAASTVR